MFAKFYCAYNFQNQIFPKFAILAVQLLQMTEYFNSNRPGFFGCLGPMEGGRGGGGWGRRKALKAYNSKTIHGIEMKFGRVVVNHKLK